MELTSDFMDVIVGWAKLGASYFTIFVQSVSFFGVSFTVTVPGVESCCRESSKFLV